MGHKVSDECTVPCHAESIFSVDLTVQWAATVML